MEEQNDHIHTYTKMKFKLQWHFTPNSYAFVTLENSKLFSKHSTTKMIIIGRQLDKLDIEYTDILL